MFYSKFMCFCTTFIKKLKIFIKKQRRYEFLKIIVFWHIGLKILSHEVPTVQCSVQMDQMGKECLATGLNLYKYKSCLDIPILAMIDDVAAASKCGVDSLD